MLLIANGVLALLVLLCGFAGQTYGLRPLAVGFVLSWLLYVTSWSSDWSPAILLEYVGWNIGSIALWSLADAIMGMAALTFGRDRWWGLALWAAYTLQCVMHVSYEAEAWTWAQYRAGLDATFLIQVSIFVLAGGKGVVDYGKRLFSGGSGRVRRLRLGGSASSAKEVERG